MADLLVRSDVLARLFPDSIPPDRALEDAPGLGLTDRHYRVIDIKFKGIHINQEDEVGATKGLLPFQAQVWVYNRALGRIQG